MRGRKPKPAYLRAVEGSVSRHLGPNPDEPVPDPVDTDMEPPAHLSALEGKIWREQLSRCPEGMITTADLSTFEEWCVSRANYILSKAKVDAAGIIVKGPGGSWMSNPFEPKMRNFMERCHKLASELGFTPTSRTRVKVKKSTGSVTPFSDLKAFKPD